MKHEMTNTGIFCMKAMLINGSAWSLDLAKQKWPHSRNIRGKEHTIRRHMNMLVQSGYARKFGEGMYELTDAGRAAAVASSQVDRPVMLRSAQ